MKKGMRSRNPEAMTPTFRAKKPEVTMPNFLLIGL